MTLVKKDYPNHPTLHDKFVADEAEKLKIPAEWIKQATYVGKGNQVLYFGKRLNDLYALIASHLNLGVLEVTGLKYHVSNIARLETKQEEYENYIFPEKGEDTKSYSKRSANYHWILVENIANYKGERVYLYIPKHLPHLTACELSYTTYKNNVPHNSKVVYYVDYSKTLLGATDNNGCPVGAWAYLPAVMYTRARRKAYEVAFGNCSDYLFKLRYIQEKEESEEPIEAIALENKKAAMFAASNRFEEPVDILTPVTL